MNCTVFKLFRKTPEDNERLTILAVVLGTRTGAHCLTNEEGIGSRSRTVTYDWYKSLRVSTKHINILFEIETLPRNCVQSLACVEQYMNTDSLWGQRWILLEPAVRPPWRSAAAVARLDSCRLTQRVAVTQTKQNYQSLNLTARCATSLLLIGLDFFRGKRYCHNTSTCSKWHVVCAI